MKLIHSFISVLAAAASATGDGKVRPWEKPTETMPRFKESAGWITRTASGRLIASRQVVVATGANRRPHSPGFKKRDIKGQQASYS